MKVHVSEEDIVILSTQSLWIKSCGKVKLSKCIKNTLNIQKQKRGGKIGVKMRRKWTLKKKGDNDRGEEMIEEEVVGMIGEEEEMIEEEVVGMIDGVIDVMTTGETVIETEEGVEAVTEINIEIDMVIEIMTNTSQVGEKNQEIEIGTTMVGMET